MDVSKISSAPWLLTPRHFINTGPVGLLEDTVRLCLDAGMTRDELLAASGLHGTGTVAAVLARWDREALRLAAHLEDDPCPLEGGVDGQP